MFFFLQAITEYSSTKGARPGQATPFGIIFTDGFGQKDTTEAATLLRSLIPNMYAVAINRQVLILFQENNFREKWEFDLYSIFPYLIYFSKKTIQFFYNLSKILHIFSHFYVVSMRQKTESILRFRKHMVLKDRLLTNFWFLLFSCNPLKFYRKFCFILFDFMKLIKKISVPNQSGGARKDCWFKRSSIHRWKHR